jgi:hypothetical protein
MCEKNEKRRAPQFSFFSSRSSSDRRAPQFSFFFLYLFCPGFRVFRARAASAAMALSKLSGDEQGILFVQKSRGKLGGK